RSSYYAAYDLAPFRVHVVEVSRLGLAFECEREFKPGLSWDITFEDDAGHTIGGRVDTVRCQRGLFGRTPVPTPFLPLDPPRAPRDALRPAQLVARCGRPGDATFGPAAAAPYEPLRTRLLDVPEGGRMRRFLRRR